MSRTLVTMDAEFAVHDDFSLNAESPFIRKEGSRRNRPRNWPPATGTLLSKQETDHYVKNEILLELNL